MLSLLLSYLSFMFARDAVVVSLPCDTKVQEHLNINHQDLELAVVTSDNSTELVAVLIACGIEKAQVGGYNHYKIPMVLYSNGALVPYDVNRPVPYALYFYKCGCDYKIICGVYEKNGKDCRYFEVCHTEKPKKYVQKEYCPPNPAPYCPPVKPPVVRPPVCNTIVPYCPPSAPVCPRPEPYCPPAELCPYYSQNYTKCVNTPCGKRFSRISTAKTFKYESPCCLNVFGRTTVLSQEKVDLSRRGNASIPNVLYNYNYLQNIYRELKNLYPNTFICLYIDCFNCVYVRINSCLYRVISQPGCPIQRTPVNSEELSRLSRRGLFGVEFSC